MIEKLHSLSVRIRSQEEHTTFTIGSGLLYVAKHLEYACVLTAAHVLVNKTRPVESRIFIECFPEKDDKDHEKYVFEISEKDIVFHEKYTNAPDESIKAENDIALVRLPWKEWMNKRPEISWCKAAKGMRLMGCGYGENSTEDDIQLDHVDFLPKKSKITNDSNHSDRTTAKLGGDFKINPANRISELAGFSGTALANARQHEIVIVAFANGIPFTNGHMGRVFLTGVRCATELIEKEIGYIPPQKYKVSRNQKQAWKWIAVFTAAVLILGEAMTRPWDRVPEKEDNIILETMPRELEECEVTINGKIISLPTTFAYLEQLGWTFVNDEETRSKRIPSQSSDVAYLTDGSGSIIARYRNSGENKADVECCVVYSLELVDYLLNMNGKTTAVEGPMGLVLGQSVLHDVDWPDGYSEFESSRYSPGLYHQYYVEKNDGSTQTQRFGFDPKTGVLNRIIVSNLEQSEVLELSKSIEMPNYIDANLAKWLGVEIELQRGEYCFPVGKLLSEYRGQGYAVESFVTKPDQDDSCLDSGSSKFVQLSKDELYILAQVCNPFAIKKLDRSCFLGVISSSDFNLPFGAKDPDENTELIPYRPVSVRFILDDNEYTIQEELSRTELESLLKANGVRFTYEKNGDIVFYPNAQVKGVEICCAFDGDFDRIKDIRVDMCNALMAYFSDSSE